MNGSVDTLMREKMLWGPGAATVSPLTSGFRGTQKKYSPACPGPEGWGQRAVSCTKAPSVGLEGPALLDSSGISPQRGTGGPCEDGTHTLTPT